MKTMNKRAILNGISNAMKYLYMLVFLDPANKSRDDENGKSRDDGGRLVFLDPAIKSRDDGGRLVFLDPANKSRDDGGRLVFLDPANKSRDDKVGVAG